MQINFAQRQNINFKISELNYKIIAQRVLRILKIRIFGFKYNKYLDMFCTAWISIFGYNNYNINKKTIKNKQKYEMQNL